MKMEFCKICFAEQSASWIPGMSLAYTESSLTLQLELLSQAKATFFHKKVHRIKSLPEYSTQKGQRGLENYIKRYLFHV